MAGPVSLRELLMGASAWLGSESPGGPSAEGGGNAAGTPEPPWREDEICVVGIFGKTALRLNSEKFSLVNTVCDRQVFPLFHHQDPGDPGTGIKTKAVSVGEAGGAGDPGAAAGDSLRGGEKPEADRNPPVLYHNSRARSTGACNCGRKQAPRDDPFDIKAANYDFYQLLEEKCCGKLDHINFPVFEPSTPDPAPAKNEPSPAPPDSDAEKLKEKEPQTQGESTSLSLALSLGQSTDSLGSTRPTTMSSILPRKTRNHSPT